MRRGTLYVLLLLVAACWVLAYRLGTVRQVEPSVVNRPDDLTVERVRRFIAESPSDYFVAVHEVVDSSDCVGTPINSPCVVSVKVIDLIASDSTHERERQAGWSYRTYEVRQTEPWSLRAKGRRRLVLAVRSKSHPDSFVDRVFIVDPTPEAVEQVTGILDTVSRTEQGLLFKQRPNRSHSARASDGVKRTGTGPEA